MHRRCAILNPRAGRGQAKQQYPALVRALREAGLAFDLVMTAGQHDATRLTHALIERGYQQIIAVGGDGTLHEVVNAIVANRLSGGPGAVLGIVALGTGNDFIKSLDPETLPNRYHFGHTVRRLAEGKTRTIDAGHLTIKRDGSAGRPISRSFINDVGLGIHAQVAAESHRLTRLKGWMVYAVAALKSLATYRAFPLCFALDDQTIQRRLLLACLSNGRCQGAGFWLTPHALLDDGMLDMCLIDAIRPDELIYLPLVLQGRHTALRQVTMGRSRRIVVTGEHPFLVSSDGEIIATDARSLEVEIIHQILDIIV